MLRNLTIQSYRCFEDFYINGLEKVNLFVGKNNSGKTSLLEAIYLLVNPNKMNGLITVLKHREDVLLSNNEYIETNEFLQRESVKHFFYNHYIYDRNQINIIAELSKAISVPTLMNDDKYVERIYFSLTFFKNQSDENGTLELKFFDLGKKQEGKYIINLDIEDKITTTDIYSLFETTNYIFVSHNKKDLKNLKNMWNSIYLTDKENKVVKALRIIEPKVQQVGFLVQNSYDLVRLRVSEYDEPIPLSSMGDGIYRIFNIAMSLVTAENGVLLVDEIETGLHYEAQTDMWRLILETAKELNVQVFATTHSWDCITAFQEALSQVEDRSIGKLFRLDSKYGKLRAVEYDAEDLEVVTSEGIEVR